MGETDGGAARYEPTWASVSRHEVPTWFRDAKLGVFLHWGLYSVPGWAPQVPDIQAMLRDHGPAHMLANNPYAEWYANTMQLPGSPTWEHHRRTYGAAPYDDFVAPFDDASATADLGALAGLCRDVGARYVVLTTKHHDGFCLWPAGREHPVKGRYHARRDLVGDLTEAVRDAGLRMGLYYSGGYDWPYNGAVLASLADVLLATPGGEAYRSYATAHVRELIDRYRPSVLWNDICWPGGGNLAELFAHYYDTVPEGVVNDRWLEATPPADRARQLLVRGAGRAAQAAWRLLPARYKALTFPNPRHVDFTTPEYASPEGIRREMWEATRGIGHSFGANRHERPEDLLTTTDLVRSFVDVVAKGGNLLIGLGPNPDGTIPPEQQAPVRGLGTWLATNGEAVFATRPWTVAGTTTTEGSPVRFTCAGDVLYATVLEAPATRDLGLRDVDASGVTDVRVLGLDQDVTWSVDGGQLRVELPDRLPVSPALALALRPADGVGSTATPVDDAR